MLTHKGTQTIKTKRLILRKFSPDDAADMYNNWANDAKVTEFLRWKPHESAEATRDLLEIWCEAYQHINNYNWVITLDGAAIGSITVVHMRDKCESAELGYSLGYNFWNKGYMSEAVAAVVDFLFKEVGVNRISISHAVKNPASGRVAQKCGMIYEGTHRQSYKSCDGKFHDIAEYAILKEDWK